MSLAVVLIAGVLVPVVVGFVAGYYDSRLMEGDAAVAWVGLCLCTNWLALVLAIPMLRDARRSSREGCHSEPGKRSA